MPASGVEENLTPGTWNFTRTRGDIMRPTRFAVTIDDETATTAPVAQVRADKSHTSTLVLDLDATATGTYVDVPGSEIELDVDPGVYYWDLEVDDLTVLSGTFRVLPDVSEEGS